MLSPLLALACLFASALAQGRLFAPPQIKTTVGTVHGTYFPEEHRVYTYLGIPYAKPPIGALRFAPPVPLRQINATIQAQQFMPSCPGNVRLNGSISYATVKDTMKGILGQAGDVFSEDCLGINVWTTGKPKEGEKGKAVMVWIYGGGFNSGNSNSPVYNGARLAKEQDVIVVSINYRVHIFGFPGAGFLADKNPGFLDQRLGLEWVRENIGEFGGDPKRITLFGQSAGGISVDMHTYAWKDDPIVAGYISSSGSTTDKSVTSVNGTGWWSASSKLGCGGIEVGAKSLECMKTKSVDAILAATKSGPRVGAFGPSPDGKVVFADYNARRAKGDFVKRPMLVGNTNNEGALYEMLGQPNVFSNTNSPGIGCLSHATAKARVDAGVKAWRYLYAAEFPNMDIGKTGAYHTADIGIWFGTTEFLSHKPDTEEEKKLINTIMPAWAGFAKDPENGLSKLGWPVYDGTKATVVRIGGKDSAEIKFEERGKFDRYGKVGEEKIC